jgi:hypothetical protein
MSEPTAMRTWTFAEHKETTAADCEAMAKAWTDVAAKVREGNMRAFEQFVFEGGTEEGDAKINAMLEIFALRYAYRLEHIKDATT